MQKIQTCVIIQMVIIMINLGKISKFGKEVILKETENGCLECISHCKDNYGYTRIMINQNQERLFRYIYEKRYGKIPDKMQIRHKCDNPSCCNINHLEIGTAKDNAMDKVVRNRSRKGIPNFKARGINNNNNKLNESQVIEIYLSDLSYNKLAKKYNVSKITIYLIKNKKIWNWLTNDLAR